MLPNWVPDSDVTECGICATEFSILVRKHHCRSCGNIFCDHCSKTRRPLKSIGLKQSVRLCDICAKDSRLCDEENVPYQTTQLTHAAVFQRWVALCTTHNSELIKEVVRGIPNTLRGIIWAELTDACESIKKNSAIYQLYKVTSLSSEISTQLDLDVPRTFSNFPKFGPGGDNSTSLRNVLTAYANFNPTIGYCQGMTFLVGILLMHTDEESSFWILVQMMKKLQLVTFYQNDDKVANVYIQSFKSKFADIIPDLSRHMESEGCDAEVFATLWIRTIFASDLEISKVFRIWDVFFTLGIEFLVEFIVVIFKLLKGEIILRKGHDLLLYITKSLPNMININFNSIMQESVSRFLDRK